MPASTLDPVNAAIRNSLSKTTSETNLDKQLAGATKKALLADIEFEAAGSYQSTILDKLKTKYIVLKSSETQQISNSEKMGADETLTLPKHELYPLEAVQLGWSNTEWAVGAGMVNMGNTCYLNSTLQALFHVPALVNWLVSDKQHMSQCEDSGGLCIICAMRKTLQDSQQRNTNSIRPFLIYNKLRVVCRNLIPGRQEDAHEFLRYLVEAMEKAYLSRFKNHSEFDSRTKETTPLNQILGGYLRSAVRCLECGHVSTTFQHFQDLLLDIRKSQTLEEALDGYFSREKLDDESYHCESCQKKVPATKQFSLERAPMVLCIQLKRFSVSNNKITKHIQFRQRLELTKYARHRPSVPLVYRFVALVTHMGPTVGCGHYTAVAQAPCGNYYQFDDSMVRPISHQAVFNTNAYIMLYELECPPFTQKSQQNNNTSSKIKTSTNNFGNSNSNSSSINNRNTNCNTPPSQQDKSTVSSKLQLNGSRGVYGPELPPKLEMIVTAATTISTFTTTTMTITTATITTTTNQNGIVSSSNNGEMRNNNRKVNGNSSYQEALSSSSESDSEQQSTSFTYKHKENDMEAIATTSYEVVQKRKSPKTSSLTQQFVNSNVCSPSRSCSSSSVSSLSSSKDGGESPNIPDSFIVACTTAATTTTTAMTITTATTSTQPVTKLVPYDVDDDDDEDDDEDDEDNEDRESSSSTASSSSNSSASVKSETTANLNQRNKTSMAITTAAVIVSADPILSSVNRIPTKATIGDWQVTSSVDHNAHELSNEGKSWDKKKSKVSSQKEEKYISTPTTITELLKMSHGGYSTPVSSWSGSRANLDKEIHEERREDRKRSLCDNVDQGRVKHMKTNSSSNGLAYKSSNPGYNRLQEFHNIKNSWKQNNTNSGSSSFNSRQFYNTSGKHRNRRNNFHHKNSNYHKNSYTFRQ